ncbi:hypothetical protein ACFSHR_05060 [Azotobacter chroococcum]
MSCAVIFGGSGFIGVFFAKQLLATGDFAKVYLFDKEQVADKPFPIAPGWSVKRRGSSRSRATSVRKSPGSPKSRLP